MRVSGLCPMIYDIYDIYLYFLTNYLTEKITKFKIFSILEMEVKKMKNRTVHTPGRKPKAIPENLLSIYNEMNTTDMAKHYQVSRATISKWLKIKRQEAHEE